MAMLPMGNTIAHLKELIVLFRNSLRVYAVLCRSCCTLFDSKVQQLLHKTVLAIVNVNMKFS